MGVYQRLAGEILKARSGEAVFIAPEEAKAAMGHVLATLEFLGVKVDRRKLKARRTRPQIGLLSHGGIRRGILKALKASGSWMSYDEIVDSILHTSCIELPVERRRHFQQKIREAVFNLRGTGLIQCEHTISAGDGSRRQRWRLVGRNATPPIP